MEVWRPQPVQNRPETLRTGQKVSISFAKYIAHTILLDSHLILTIELIHANTGTWEYTLFTNEAEADLPQQDRV